MARSRAIRRELTPSEASARIPGMTENGASHYQPAAPPPYLLEVARERAIRLLTDGYAYDAITMEEFERRLGQMSHADSPRAIDALVADLAPAAGVFGAANAPMPAVPGEGRILAIMNETRRRGPWQVPELLRVKAFMSDVKLDLRYAILPASCLIDVAAFMANVSIIVPPRLVVDVDVGSFMATIGNDADAIANASYILPHVRVRGSAFMAEVQVKVRAPRR